MASMVTRIQVDDYEEWKAIFDEDRPGARAAATGYRIARGVDDPNEVLVQVDFASTADALTGRDRLVAASVLERFAVLSGPTVVEDVEVVVAEPAGG
jgi:hypothetical protein